MTFLTLSLFSSLWSENRFLSASSPVSSLFLSSRFWISCFWMGLSVEIFYFCRLNNSEIKEVMSEAGLVRSSICSMDFLTLVNSEFIYSDYFASPIYAAAR